MSVRANAAACFALWGSELSPFALKVEALLRFHGVTHCWAPAHVGTREAFRLARRRRALVAGRRPLTWPDKHPLDEYPLVPFLFGADGENLYDSSAIAEWLDRRAVGRDPRAPRLVPDADPALRFGVRLVDEALDEVGLYLVHHNRWVVAARDNDAGARLAAEMRPLFGPLARILAYVFPARQVRRLPYLFSVAPADADFRDLPRRLRPPARAGWPPTHALLETATVDLLAALDPVLGERPFLFGGRLTLADASVYGQLGMNRRDPSAWRWLGREGPETQRWVERCARGELGDPHSAERLVLDAELAPLLRWISELFVPLMQQNLAAWQRHCAAGETLFNEAACERGRALYDGVLRGQPFRSVAKTFQVRVWQRLRAEWDALGAGDRARLEALLPSDHGLDRDVPEDQGRCQEVGVAGSGPPPVTS